MHGQDLMVVALWLLFGLVVVEMVWSSTRLVGCDEHRKARNFRRA